MMRSAWRPRSGSRTAWKCLLKASVVIVVKMPYCMPNLPRLPPQLGLYDRYIISIVYDTCFLHTSFVIMQLKFVFKVIVLKFTFKLHTLGGDVRLQPLDAPCSFTS